MTRPSYQALLKNGHEPAMDEPSEIYLSGPGIFVPLIFTVVSDLPLTASGKLKRGQVGRCPAPRP